MLDHNVINTLKLYVISASSIRINTFVATFLFLKVYETSFQLAWDTFLLLLSVT
jgi:hypothetical protein